MSGVSIRIDGSDEVGRKLAAAVTLLTDPRPLYDRLGSALVLSTSQRFERGTGSDGNPWPQSIRVLTQGGKTMQNTGFLRRSLTHEVSGTGVSVGTNAIYAAVHQFGATIRPKSKSALRFKIGNRFVTKKQVTIPARPFLGVDQNDAREIEQIARNAIASALGELTR